MALAEAAPDPTAPQPLLEDVDRLQVLRSFLLEHFELDPDDPRAQIDGHQMAGTFAVYATDRALPPQNRSRFYQDLRSLGLLVGPGTGNRTKIHGVRPRPHATGQLTALEARWPTIADDLAAYRRDRAVESAHQAVAGTLQFTRQVAEEAADTIVELMRESKDVNLRARMANLILDRTIPAVRARDIADPAIEISAAIARPALADVEALLSRDEDHQHREGQQGPSGN
jgi:hypothetical protein